MPRAPITVKGRNDWETPRVVTGERSRLFLSPAQTDLSHDDDAVAKRFRWIEFVLVLNGFSGDCARRITLPRRSSSGTANGLPTLRNFGGRL